jgi:magnesium chelatase family protein
MAVKVYSAQVTGLKADIIEVEVDMAAGFLHHFTVVGLPDKAIEESKDRISAAIKNSGFISPQKKNQRITVALAPANLKKEGPVFDLAIALAYLLASKQLFFDVKERLFLGELALDGLIRPIKGTLAIVKYARKAGFKEIFVPKENSKEAALIKGLKIFGCGNLKDVINHLNQKEELNLSEQPETKINFEELQKEFFLDFTDIKGQETAKRGLEIAAAGGHNILMVGPAGTGKTMLARSFSNILPPPSFEEILEITLIHSVAGTLTGDFLIQRPFRSPHHTASYVALVGGGTYPHPGEITLSHRGVLFLDEFPEFERRVIEALRQPLEDGMINVARAKDSITFPARFIMICAMNPCPCGNLGSRTKLCVCSQAALMKYQRKISSPILDRIDLCLEVPQVEHEKLSEMKDSGEPSKIIQERVIKARDIQGKRFSGYPKKIFTNSEMGVRELKRFVFLSENVKNILNQAAKRLDLSGRAYHRVIKLARTIADLEGADQIKEPHILEALQYRPK